ncbi:MAG: hypothetical protein M9894_11570 [Planctomycetes bacterium]|nr:hypothetical protein [Planctomycetota bacterium]
MVGVLLTSMVMGLSFVAAATTADVLSVTQATTRAHLEAERCLRLCLTELRRARRDGTTSPTWSASGLQAGDPDDVLEVRQALGVDPADPRQVLWGDTLRIAFEPDGDEVPNNGVDDDGDGRVDEGQVVLHVVGSTAPPVVAARDVSRFAVQVDQPAPGVLRISLEVRVEQTIDRAARGDASAARPRASYTARGSVTLLN